MTVRRAVAGGLALIVAVVSTLAVTGTVVLAHAELLSSSPAAGAILDSSPGTIVLTFSESVDPAEDSIELVDADGATVETGPVEQDRGHDTLAVAVDGPLEGSYVVSWRAVSADSHPVHGAFTFAVGIRTDVAAGLLDSLGARFDTPPGTDVALAIGRFLAYAALAVLVGGFGAVAWCDRRLLVAGRTRRLLIGAATVGALATATMIAAQAAAVSTGALDPSAWLDVVRSSAGRWWFARLLAFVAAAVLIQLGRRVLDRAVALVAAAAGGLALLSIVAAGGHGVTGRWEPAGFVATVAHLAAMSLWVGGLATIVLVGRPSRLVLLARFSPLALGAVVVVALTGSFNALRQLDGIDNLTSSAYGRWLIIKVAFVAVVVAVAALNRRTVRRGERAAPDPATAPGLGRSVAVELVGMVAVLVATVGLVGSPPPLDSGGAAPIPVSVTATSADGSAHARIDLFPAATAGTELTITVYSHDGVLEAADEITVTANLPARDIGPIAIETDQIAPNVATSDDATFPLPGTWEITVTARYGEFDQLVFTQPVEIRAAR